ncbi:MAG: hypothetical protein JSW52_03555 [Candidatus Coatesbacteria bacterium]|nr:MAG: hypothetical protein JSW52_03555 [Candidatus Coatesbacteria bacterium]
MKLTILLTLLSYIASAIVPLVAAATAPTITVYTEPPELGIWVDGERLGVGEVVLFGPFDDYVEVTVKGKGYEEKTQVVDPPTEEGEDVVIIMIGEKTRAFSWASMGIGAGIALGILGLLLVAGD